MTNPRLLTLIAIARAKSGATLPEDESQSYDQKAQERATVLMLVHLSRIMQAARRGWRHKGDMP
jgi:hypothetical protein